MVDVVATAAARRENMQRNRKRLHGTYSNKCQHAIR